MTTPFDIAVSYGFKRERVHFIGKTQRGIQHLSNNYVMETSTSFSTPREHMEDILNDLRKAGMEIEMP